MELSSSCFTEIDVTLDLRWVSRESLDFPKKMSSHLLHMMWNAGWLCSQCSGNVLHFELIWFTPIYFAFLRWHQCSSRLLTVFLGILWFSIKEIEVPYVFDWQHGIRLHANRGIGTHLAAMGKSHGFSRVEAGKWGIFSSYGRDGYLKLGFLQRNQHSRLVTMDTSVI